MARWGKSVCRAFIVTQSIGKGVAHVERGNGSTALDSLKLP